MSSCFCVISIYWQEVCRQAVTGLLVIVHKPCLAESASDGDQSPTRGLAAAHEITDGRATDFTYTGQG